MNIAYNPLNILRQSPEAIKTFVLLVLAALVIQDTINITAEQTAAWGAVIERGLQLLYVAPARDAKLQADLDALNS